MSIFVFCFSGWVTLRRLTWPDSHTEGQCVSASVCGGESFHSCRARCSCYPPSNTSTAISSPPFAPCLSFPQSSIISPVILQPLLFPFIWFCALNLKKQHRQTWKMWPHAINTPPVNVQTHTTPPTVTFVSLQVQLILSLLLQGMFSMCVCMCVCTRKSSCCHSNIRCLTCWVSTTQSSVFFACLHTNLWQWIMSKIAKKNAIWCFFFNPFRNYKPLPSVILFQWYMISN